MIRKLMTVVAVVGMIGATPALAANQCKDTKGKFIKCPPAAKKPFATKANVVKGKDGKCRVASGPKKGQFTKC